MAEKNNKTLPVLKNNKIAIIFLLAITIFYTAFVIKTNQDKELDVFELPQINDENIYFGKKDSDNEILFLFDYSCPYCHDWVNDIFPAVKEKWLQSGKAKFSAQSMVYLNETSLKVSKIDQNIKEHYPEKYYDWFFSVMQNQNDQTDLEDNVNEQIAKYSIDENVVSSKPNVNVLSVTRSYTKTYKVEYVPTLIINGRKVEDPFDLKEIEGLLK
jgi:protein-disulfide isomerase